MGGDWCVNVCVCVLRCLFDGGTNTQGAEKITLQYTFVHYFATCFHTVSQCTFSHPGMGSCENS